MNPYLPDLLSDLAAVCHESDQDPFISLSKQIDEVPRSRLPNPSTETFTSKKSLDRAISGIPPDLSLRMSGSIAAQQSPWSEASRGIPEFFAGGYAYSILVDEHGICGPEPIRVGLLLQQDHVAYPGHAHDAEEFYFILSGTAAWRVDDQHFQARPGDLIHHASAAIHEMNTADEPLLAIWAWRGNLGGRFWYESNPNIDCPLS